MKSLKNKFIMAPLKLGYAKDGFLMKGTLAFIK
jgi:hypothetical protein